MNVTEKKSFPLLTTPLQHIQNLRPHPSATSSHDSDPPDNSPEAVTPPPLFDLKVYIDGELLMSPTSRTPVVHSAPYTYGAEHHPGELSQVRSTADLEAFPASSNGHSAKTDPQSAPIMQAHSHGNMLPPIRSADAYPSQPTHGWYHSNAYPPSYTPFAAYSHPQYPQHPAYRHPATYQSGLYPSMYSHAYHVSSHAAASPQEGKVTPLQYGSSGAGTIQPSAFGAWSDSSQQPRRPEATVPGSAVGSAEEDEFRRPTTSTLRVREESLSERPSPTGTVAHLSDHQSDSDYESTATVPAAQRLRAAKTKKQKRRRKPRVHEVHGENVVYTTDAEVKQTPDLKRMCFNCESKTPPSWRKSILNDGRILCNKCGIFERTHRRARPPQNDDQKLRKGMGLLSYRRDAPPSVLVRDGAESPLSPYSVSSQHTPLSGTFGFGSYGQPHHASMPPMAMIHGSSSASVLSSARLTDWRHSQAHAYSPVTSPYHQQYFTRRNASYQTAPTFSGMVSPALRSSASMGSASIGAPLTAPSVGMPMTYWDTGRQESAGETQQAGFPAGQDPDGHANGNSNESGHEEESVLSPPPTA